MYRNNYFLPAGPKFSTKPSEHPTRYKALLTKFAKKKSVPIDPPNSGPNVLLIITEILVKEYFKS